MSSDKMSCDLPQSLVNSMKVLFDILDERKTGYIKLTELEKFWESSNRDLVENLKKIAPNSGLISFDRFCIGLKMSRTKNTQVVQHHNVLSNKNSVNGDINKKDFLPPKKPPRIGQPQQLPQSQQMRPPIQDQLSNRMEILNNLEKWQRNRIPSTNIEETIDFQELYAQPQRSTKSSKRRDRRHTLQNSIDYNILKQLKQIEFEKEILMDGFTMVEKARNWYLQQLRLMDDKLKSVANGHKEQWTETQQERLELQKIRINEVNRSLVTLIENWDRVGGFPMHINLEIRNHYSGLKK